MTVTPNRPPLLRLLALSVIGVALLPMTSAFAATTTWSGASGADTNWSNADNWAGGVPTGADDVKFFNGGTNGTPGLPTSFMDSAFGGFIGTLQFGNTNGVHTLAIAPGLALNVTNGNVVIGTPGDVGAARNLTNSIGGLEAALNLSNSTAVLAIQQGSATSVSGTRGNLDLSGLGTFSASLSRIGLGSTAVPNPGSANQREAGALLLARTNLIALSYTDTLGNYQTAGKNNALELSRNPGNNAGILSLLALGQTNAFFVDSLGFGRDKASASAAAWMGFNPAFTNSGPSATFRGAAGPGSRVTWWAIADMNASASSAQVAIGTNDFTGGTVDALVDVMSLGRDCSPNHTATASIIGVLTFNAGVMDVNTLYAGNQSLGPNTSVPANIGILNVNGTGLLRVNNSLVLGRTTQTSGAAALSTRGVLNIRGGTVQASSISCGAVSTNNLIAINGGTLCVTNAAGSTAKAITTVAATNATLQFVVADGGPANLVVTNLITGGAGNTISFPSIATFATYPKQITVIKYSVAIAGAGFNFSLGTVPGSAPGAYLSNNTLNASIDLILPTDPRPRITSLPDSYGGSPGDNVSFTAGYSGAAPLTVSWMKEGTSILADGPTGSGSTLAGTTTGTLSLSNAQESDSGSYALVASNPYGSATSSPPASLIISTGDIAPIVNGPANLTVVQGNNATFTPTVSGKPVPSVQWYKDGVEIPGETSVNLTIANAQYPADQALYSIVASNLAGVVTNSATLTVHVAPSISMQPASVTVTNTQAAELSVTAGGVPAVTYQWRRNGVALANATDSRLTFASATPADIGTYTVVVANAAGSVVSDPATLTVNSTMTVAALTPANGATAICFDTPLTVTFSTPPLLRKAGTIRIYNTTNTSTPVDTLDLSQNVDLNGTYAANIQPRLIGGESFMSFPVIITGNSAAIYPHAGVMKSNQSYYVTIDNGVFTDGAGAYFAGITTGGAWQFSTKAALPASASTSPVVAADGTGDFCTVQGALDSLSASSPTPRLIQIRDGLYTEIINLKKANVHLRGQSRGGTVLAYANNANLQGSTHFRMSFKVDASDVAVESLTITNSTPKGGSQAEALMVESDRKRFIAYNVNICSYQDTILMNTEGTQCYFRDTLVQGDTDFIWGPANAFFTNCEIKQLNTSTALNPTGTAGTSSNGMSFINCAFTRSAGLTGAFMGRTRSIVNGNAAILNCRIDDHIFGWSTDALPTSSYRLWDFGNSNLAATASKVLSNCIALASGDARILPASDATNWLYGWTPALMPRIVTQPSGATLAAGGSTTLSVVATSMTEPTYQWQLNGADVSGATGASLTINNATANQAGDYTVVVSTPAGSVTSAVATVTVGNTPPLLAPIADYTVNVGTPVSFTAVTTDPDVPAQALTFTLLAGPTNATVDAVSGGFHFRPLVSQAGSSNYVTVQVADNGTPSQSATQSFSILVNSLGTVTLGAGGYVGGVFQSTVSGDVGPDYAVRATQDFVTWQTIFRTNSPAMPFTWQDPDTELYPFRYYQVIIGPPLP